MSAFRLTRSPHNPILRPNPGNDWEAKVVLNPAAVYEDGMFYLYYRAAGHDTDHLIHIGLATSTDGVNFTRMTKDGRATMMLVNGGHEDLNVRITLPECRNACGIWEKYEYVQDNRQVDADGFPVCSGRIQSEKGNMMVRLDAQAVVFLTEI